MPTPEEIAERLTRGLESKVSAVRTLAAEAIRAERERADALLATLKRVLPWAENAVRAGLDSFSPEDEDGIVASHEMLKTIRETIQRAEG